MDPSQLALQALIDKTEALGWDSPNQLDVLDEAPPNQDAFAIVLMLLTRKPLHPQQVRATMASVWNFGSPTAIKLFAPNKFLFVVPLQTHVNRIL